MIEWVSKVVRELQYVFAYGESHVEGTKVDKTVNLRSHIVNLVPVDVRGTAFV